MPNIKICHRVEEIPFLCPLCKGNIQRIIKEDNAINIDPNGQAIGLENLLFDDFFECASCHEPLNGLVHYDRKSYKLMTKGHKQLIQDKIKETLSINPFGKL